MREDVGFNLHGEGEDTSAVYIILKGEDQFEAYRLQDSAIEELYKLSG